MSDWVYENLSLYDKVTKQTHRFFNNVKDNTTCFSSKDVEELARLKERELMISQLQSGRQNLEEEEREIEFLKKKFQNKQKLLEKLENSIDNMDRNSFKENKRIFDSEIKDFKEERNDKEIWAPPRVPIFKTIENFKEQIDK